jgi:hypothetical protein
MESFCICFPVTAFTWSVTCHSSVDLPSVMLTFEIQGIRSSGLSELRLRFDER